MAALWRSLLMLILVGANGLFAAQPYQPRIADPVLESWRWQRVARMQDESPSSMVADANGALWIGLDDGVIRYDGLEWTKYSDGDGVGGPVYGVACAPNGDVYAATVSGLSRHSAGKWERIFPVGTNTVAMQRVAVGSDGTVWAGGAGMIVRIKGRNRMVYCRPNLGPNATAIVSTEKSVVVPSLHMRGNLEAICETREGEVWVAFSTGELQRLNLKRDPGDTNAWREFTRADGYMAGSGAQAIVQTRDGQVWVGNSQHNGGLNRFDPATGKWAHIRLNELLRSDESVFSMVESPDGTLWLGGMSKLYSHRGGKWNMYRAPEVPVTSAEVSALVVAKDYLWIVGYTDGLQKLDFTAKHWVKYERLNYQCETPDGTQWFISADEGVVGFDGQDWRRYGVEDGLIAFPSILLCSSDGKLWAAGGHSNVAATAWFDGTRWEAQLHPEMHVRTLDYRAVIEADDGSLWFGTYVDGGARVGDGGLLRYQPKLGVPGNRAAWTSFLGGNHSTSYGFAQMDGGKLYSGSYLGLIEFDGKTWVDVAAMKGQRVDALASSTNRQQLWIGTRGNGVFSFDGKSVRRYSREDGLAANTIRSLTCDPEDRLWAMTAQGVSLHLDGEWISDAFAQQKIASEGGRVKRARDGSIWINQCYRSWMRRVLNGTNVDETLLRDFWTVHYTRERLPPETKIGAFVDRVPQPGNTVLSWSGADAWSRTAGDELVFSWRTNGGGWTPFSKKNSHVFLELATGKHVFEVRARDADLNIDPTPARVEFLVLPPVWEQPWFLGVMALSIGIIVTQTTRVLRRDRVLRKANQALAIKIEEQRQARLQLASKSALLEEKTELLQQEIEERKVAQSVVELQRAELQKEIEMSERMQREVELVHKQLLVASRQAGMAEIAANVLHNVGNLLNSLNTSAHCLADHVRKSKLANLKKLDAVLRENRGDLARFLTEDERGRRLPDYVSMLAENLRREQGQLQEEILSIRRFIDEIIDAIGKQQAYAQASGMFEDAVLAELVDEAVRLAEPMLIHRKIHLVRDYGESPVVMVDRHKVVQLIGTLLSNAVHACEASSAASKEVSIRIRQKGDKAVVEVEDNGIGIPSENLLKIFAQGFSVEAGRHASSLHLGALMAKEMHGHLAAFSEGPDKGARFTLELPVAKGGATGGDI